MPLLNYSTTIPAQKTIAEVQSLLAKAGATAILSEYDNAGNVMSLSFKMRLNNSEIGFRLPSEPEKILQLIKTQRGVPTRFQNIEQARKITWRIIKDWVEAQLAIIETQMVKPEQVFLPYAITNDGCTLYEKVMSDRLLLGYRD